MSHRGRAVRRSITGVVVALLVAGSFPAATSSASPTASSAEAASGSPTARPAALPAEPKNMAWARQILRRYADVWDEAEITALARALDSSNNVAATIRTTVSRQASVEARVAELYEELLERAADPSGLAFWSGRIVRGALTYENLVVTLTISPEAYTKAGATPEGYTDWVYEHVLGRPADPSGKAYWERQLAAGVSRDRFVRSFLRSRERARNLVRAGFQRYLARNVDPGGLTFWTDRYTRAQVGELDLAVSLLASGESRNAGCGYDPEHCLLPFPSSRHTAGDGDTATGVRVEFKPEWLPANASGVRMDPTEWNRNDGFSVGQTLVTRVPGIDLEETGVAPLTDIAASLDEDSPIVVLDGQTLEIVPHWVELDTNAPAGSSEQLLYIRPAENWRAGVTYHVGMRHMKDANGSTIPAPAKFARERASILAGEEWLDPLHQIETEFTMLLLENDAGFAPEDLYQAWSFTVASQENTTGRMLHIRDEALASLQGDAPDFTVTDVEVNPATGVASRVTGTFQVPNYLTGTGAAGSRFNTGADGLANPNGVVTAPFICQVPTLDPGEAARGVVYGHGLFGSERETRSGSQTAMVRDHDMLYCGTRWIGMSEEDVLTAGSIVGELSRFPALVDRSQQGILNTVFLGRLMAHDDGLVSHPAFQHANGDPLLDTSDLFYDGNSQGAVIGGAFVAVSPDVSAGVLGVAGMNYSILLERSVDFDPFFALMKNSYPSPADRALGLQLIQMLWDRGETNGYAAHLTDDPLPGTPAHRVLLHTALGDHQVATLTAEITARTAGMSIHRPVYLDGRSTDIGEDAWGIPGIAYPSTGSALIVWDSGAALSPITNVPPREGEDPHGDPRASVDAQLQKSEFLQTNGTLIDVCEGAPCTAPAT